MNAKRRYLFEGQSLSMREIKALVPRLSCSAIHEHLKAGRATRAEILNYQQRRLPGARQRFRFGRGKP